MTPHPRLGPRRHAVAIGAFFFANGAAYASWVPRLPEIRQSLGISDTVLGLVLLGGAAGGLTVSLVSGLLVDRLGSRTMTAATSIALSALLPLVALAPAPAVLFSTLVLIGALDGLTDVAQNAQALQLQGMVRRSIVNRMHAVWSIGTLLGGLAATIVALAGVGFTTQLVTVSAGLVAVTVVAAPSLLPRAPRPEAHHDHTGRRVRPGRLLLVGLFGMGLLATVAELPATEWAALVMVERFDLSVGGAGIGFVAFTAGMVIGRLSGDAIADRLGAERYRRSAALVAATGLVITAVAPTPWSAAAGFAIAGAGAAALFPMAVRRAGDLVPGATGVAMFSAGARLGVLLAAPAMGALSDATSRSSALVLVGATAAIASAAIRLPDRTGDVTRRG